eukprot:scaffold11812_cov69-Phaeocystis_antarctica.AAC.1
MVRGQLTTYYLLLTLAVSIFSRQIAQQSLSWCSSSASAVRKRRFRLASVRCACGVQCAVQRAVQRAVHAACSAVQRAVRRCACAHEVAVRHDAPPQGLEGGLRVGEQQHGDHGDAKAVHAVARTTRAGGGRGGRAALRSRGAASRSRAGRSGAAGHVARTWSG